MTLDNTMISFAKYLHDIYFFFLELSSVFYDTEMIPIKIQSLFKLKMASTKGNVVFF